MGHSAGLRAGTRVCPFQRAVLQYSAILCGHRLGLPPERCRLLRKLGYRSGIPRFYFRAKYGG